MYQYTTEYEALIQGLKKYIYLGAMALEFYGDSKIILILIREMIHCNLQHLNGYQQEAFIRVNEFSAFNITVISNTENKEVDSLANIKSMLSPLKYYEANILLIELIYRPSCFKEFSPTHR